MVLARAVTNLTRLDGHVPPDYLRAGRLVPPARPDDSRPT
jgi:hypothetical protein